MVADGNALLGVVYAGTGVNTSIIYYDAGAKQIRETGADSAGGVGTDVIFRKKGQWHKSSIGSRADGTKTEGESTLILSDAGNTATWSRTATIAGKKSTPKDVWRRVNR